MCTLLGEYHLSNFKICNGTSAIFGHRLETTSGKNGSQQVKMFLLSQLYQAYERYFGVSTSTVKIPTIKKNSKGRCKLLMSWRFCQICTNRDFSTEHWRGCGENTALGWSGTHLLLPTTLTWNASSLANVQQCSLSLLGKGDSGTHTYNESQGNTHTILPTCTDILHSWLTPDRTELQMFLTSFLRGLAEPKYFSSAVSPLTTHLTVVITLRTVYT